MRHRIEPPHAPDQDRRSARHRRAARCSARNSGERPGARSSRSATSARRPGRSPASARPIRSSSIRCEAFSPRACKAAARPTGRDRLQGQPVERQPRRRGRLRTDPARQGRSAGRRPARPTPPIRSSDQAEVNEVPCVTTNCPWQPYFFGRKGDPAKGFTWTYHVLLGPRGRHRRVPGAVGRRADQQGGRRPVPERRRRQRLGRSRSAACRRRWPRPATS